MKKKSIIVLLAVVLMVVLALAGCGKDDEATPDEQNKTLSDTVRIVALTGVGEEALAAMPEGFETESFQKLDEIKAQVLGNDYDMAIVPANTAARLYKQSGGQLLAISPMNLNGWYIMSNKGYIDSQSLSDLRGKTIVACGKDGAGDAVLRKLLSDAGINPNYGVRMEWVDTPEQVMEALKDKYTIALLNQPYVDQAKKSFAGNDDVNVNIDLGVLWESDYGYPIPSDVLIANKQFVAERMDDFEVAIDAMESSLAAAKETSAANLVFYGRSNRGIDLMKKYMISMEDFDISLLGGKSPDASFYYGIGE